MSQGIQSPNGIIHGMGDPGKGMPIVGIEIEESPTEKVHIQRANVRIGSDIKVIIPPDESVLKGLEIYQTGC
jgi:hypothetical protein